MKNKKTKYLALSGIFAALIFAATMIHIPIPVTAGYVHLGDSMIYIGASVLPFPFSLISAGIGGLLADIFAGFAYWAPFTFVIKMANAVPFVILGKYIKNKNKIVNKQNIIAMIISGVLTIVLYYIASLVVYTFLEASAQGLSYTMENLKHIFNSYAKIAALSDVAGSALQAVGGGIIYVLLAAALDRTDIKNKI